MTTTHLEGAWDCSTPGCMTTRIGGFTKLCPNCNQPQDSVLTPSEDFYRPNGARVLTSKEDIERALAGPDWNCGHCGYPNRGDTTTCTHCYRELDADDTVNRRITYDDRTIGFDPLPDRQAERLEDELDEANRIIAGRGHEPRRFDDLNRPAHEVPTTGATTAHIESLHRNADQRHEDRQRMSKLPPWLQPFYPHRRNIAIAAGVLGAFFLILIAVFTIRWLTATVDGEVTVTELHWKRQTEVEQYRTLTYSDWDYPGDARVISSNREIRSYRTVIDYYRTDTYTDYESRSRSTYRSRTCYSSSSNGNGSFSRSSYECGGTVTEYYTVPVTKTRQVPVTHQEPIYDIKYRYEIDRWVTDKWVVAEGVTPAGLRWPEPTGLNQNNQPGAQIGEQRVGDERQAMYTIVYTDSDDKSYSKEGSDDKIWSQLEIGEVVEARYNKRTGNLSSVEWDSVLTAA